MINAASVGLGWWSDELAKSIQGKSKKIKIVSCYSKNKKKELIFQKNTKLATMTLTKQYLKILKLMQ
jgi:hypothetical protein